MNENRPPDRPAGAFGLAAVGRFPAASWPRAWACPDRPPERAGNLKLWARRHGQHVRLGRHRIARLARPRGQRRRRIAVAHDLPLEGLRQRDFDRRPPKFSTPKLVGLGAVSTGSEAFIPTAACAARSSARASASPPIAPARSRSSAGRRAAGTTCTILKPRSLELAQNLGKGERGGGLDVVQQQDAPAARLEPVTARRATSWALMRVQSSATRSTLQVM